MKWGIIVFPGSNCDWDVFHAVADILGHTPQFLWHKDRDLKDSDIVVLPGGFSYGDYLRCGAIARLSPIMKEVLSFISEGRPVIGICNGFQILVEAKVLEGSLIKNKNLQFICRDVYLKLEGSSPMWLKNISNKVLKMPIAHGDGRFFASASQLKKLEDKDLIALRYCSQAGEVNEGSNPNGSLQNIAGIFNDKKNVLGLMPHPERACDSILGSTDGKLLLESIL